MTQIERRNGKNKRLIWICAGAALAIVALILILIFAKKKPEEITKETLAEAPPAQQSAAPAATAKPTAAIADKADEAIIEVTPTPAPLPLSKYTAVINADPDKAQAQVQFKLDYVNNTKATLYALVLRLWPNAIAKDSLKISTVTQEGVDSKYNTAQTGNEDPSVLTIPLDRDLLPGEKVNIGMEYTLDLPEMDGRFGVNELGMNLGNALPIMAVYENGDWRTDAYETIGDSFYSEAAEYSVLLRCPLSYTVAASGTAIEARQIEEENLYEGLYEASPARDFAACFVKNAFVETAKSENGVNVLAFTKQRKKSEKLAGIAASALSYFEGKICAYPYEQFSAVATKISGGMEYPGLILIDYDGIDGSGEALSELYIAHEAAHQWFYNLAGSDQPGAPWVDEALVEFLSFDYIRSVHGQEYMEQLWDSRFHDIQGYSIKPRMDASLHDFTAVPSGDYVYGVYARGSAMYEEIYQKLGDQKFYAVLKKIFTEKSFGVISGSELIERFSKAAGEDLAPVFEKYMSLQPAAAESEAKW